MRIAFIGSHGNNKKFIISELKKQYPNISYISGIPKKILGDNDINNYSYEEKVLFQLKIFQKQIEEEIKNENFITERSVLDSIVYCKGLHIQNLIKNQALEYIKQFPYDKIYFLKNEFIEYSKENEDIIEYQNYIQLELLKLLNDNNIDYEELIGSGLTRVQKILMYLKYNFNKKNEKNT